MNIVVPFSDTQYEDGNMIAHHEAGHAVMARLIGRSVDKIDLLLIAEGTYNGYTDWDRYNQFRYFDPNVPYDELKLKQADDDLGVALVYAAGKAAERIWYHQKGWDETLASFGSYGEHNDDLELEKELLTVIPGLKPEQLPQVKQDIVEAAMRRLGLEICWQAVEAVAQALLEGLKQTPERFILDDVQKRIANVFAKE